MFPVQPREPWRAPDAQSMRAIPNLEARGPLSETLVILPELQQLEQAGLISQRLCALIQKLGTISY